MKYLPLGRSGLKVSRLCLGTMNFGPHTTERDSFAIMDRALELGIQFFDTANVYGGQKGEGLTEQIIGRWLAQGGGRRERIVLATKVFGDLERPNLPDPNLVRGLSARKIMASCEASLRRLQTDHIDLYQMHHIDRTCPWEEIWQAFETLVAQGKVIYAGSSNFAGWDLASAQQTAAHRHFFGLISEQSIYHLANRTIELEVIPAARHYGLGLIPWSPLGGGLLGGALRQAATGRRGTPEFAAKVAAQRPKLERYEALCAQLGYAPANVAVAWLLSNPAVTAPIVGPRTIGQLEEALGALDIVLESSALLELDAIFPGPGGEAPKAYAW